MHIVTTSILKSMENANWFASLFMSLTIPSVCAEIEYTEETRDKLKYAKWFEDNLAHEYQGLLSGEECYLLQQTCLYKFIGEKYIDVIDRFHFSLPDIKSKHKQLINGVLQIDIKHFCIDITNAFELWIAKISQQQEKQKLLEHLDKVNLNLMS